MSLKRLSVTEIKEIPLEDLGKRAEMSLQGIYVLNPTTFGGTKPMTEAEYELLITTYDGKYAALKQSGLPAKLPFETAHTNLLTGILLFVPYVDDIANGDEVILKMTTLPYTGAVNESGTLIRDGAVPTAVIGSQGAYGVLNTSCAVFGKNVHFSAIIVTGAPFPSGTKVNLDGQLIFPAGAVIPPYTININGKRNKEFVGLTPNTDYYVYYVMSFGDFVSDLSMPVKRNCGN